VDAEERRDAILGAFDGVVSVVGFLFGLLIHHAPRALVASGGLGGAVAATVSMSWGIYEAQDGPWREKLRNAAAMGVSTFLGSFIPVLPFFLLARTAALLVSAAACLAVAGWIGWEKRRGLRGYLKAYAVLLSAVGLTLLVVGAVPQ
jgi:VIT1/CCC1 family predicted Fe2+/Mn2+ transporter